ncbi:hypothetical protein CEUSTIGMA_g2359.t1 [Chlamydomonas eustigma]|uniref:USP domain-containing protein n=1 Tax=Chlamydomonas eustigma TaxID=1157962 RepID=A0A250WVP0_9CHLO|nr:hypothetical protein CEUSTIGMA_g2359.t1 [Chlamydomonas eustigma]|eukprot:GAX74913.1 hypothetical protein CEUSTIGMA_g2359.t1 [Chlamydomonas eustigma]
MKVSNVLLNPSKIDGPSNLQGASSQSNHLGMVNLGNTCYLNAVLQVLVNSEGFVYHLQQAHTMLTKQHDNRMTQQDLHNQDNKIMNSPSRLPLDSEFVNSNILFAALATFVGNCCKLRSKRSPPPLDPSPILSAMSATADSQSATPRWSGFRQQDAHELLVALLGRLQGEVLALQSLLFPLTDSSRIPVSKALCPATRTVCGCMLHTLICGSCGHQSQVKEQFSHLSLQLPESVPVGRSVKLQDLMSQYFKEEVVEKSCDKCGQKCGPHKLRHSFCRLPPVLVVHLKRFRHESLEGGIHRYSKLHLLVDAASGALNVRPFCCPKRTEEDSHDLTHSVPDSPLFDEDSPEVSPKGLFQPSHGLLFSTSAAQPVEITKPTRFLVTLADSAGSTKGLPSAWRSRAEAVSATAEILHKCTSSPSSGIGGVFTRSSGETNSSILASPSPLTTTSPPHLGEAMLPDEIKLPDRGVQACSRPTFFGLAGGAGPKQVSRLQGMRLAGQPHLSTAVGSRLDVSCLTSTAASASISPAVTTAPTQPSPNASSYPCSAPSKMFTERRGGSSDQGLTAFNSPPDKLMPVVAASTFFSLSECKEGRFFVTTNPGCDSALPTPSADTFSTKAQPDHGSLQQRSTSAVGVLIKQQPILLEEDMLSEEQQLQLALEESMKCFEKSQQPGLPYCNKSAPRQTSGKHVYINNGTAGTHSLCQASWPAPPVSSGFDEDVTLALKLSMELSQEEAHDQLLTTDKQQSNQKGLDSPEAVRSGCRSEPDLALQGDDFSFWSPVVNGSNKCVSSPFKSLIVKGMGIRTGVTKSCTPLRTQSAALTDGNIKAGLNTPAFKQPDPSFAQGDQKRRTPSSRPQPQDLTILRPSKLFKYDEMGSRQYNKGPETSKWDVELEEVDPSLDDVQLLWKKQRKVADRAIPLRKVLLVEDSDVDEQGERSQDDNKENILGHCKGLDQSLNITVGEASSTTIPKVYSSAPPQQNRCLGDPAGSLVSRGGKCLEHLYSGEKKEHGIGLYSLYGAILHRGATPFSGHYVSHVKCGQEWLLFNDETVVPMKFAAILQDVAQDGYVLFYRTEGSFKS